MRTLWDFAVKILVNGAALWVAALVVSGIHFGQGAEWTGTLRAVLLVALVFGVFNAVLKPIVSALSLPLIWLTLGLFTLVINAAMLQITSWASGKLGLAFHVDHFWWDAVGGALVITFVAMVLHALIPDATR